MTGFMNFPSEFSDIFRIFRKVLRALGTHLAFHFLMLFTKEVDAVKCVVWCFINLLQRPIKTIRDK